MIWTVDMNTTRIVMSRLWETWLPVYPSHLISIISAASFSDPDREDGSQQRCSASQIKDASSKTSHSHPLLRKRETNKRWFFFPGVLWACFTSKIFYEITWHCIDPAIALGVCVWVGGWVGGGGTGSYILSIQISKSDAFLFWTLTHNPIKCSHLSCSMLPSEHPK